MIEQAVQLPSTSESVILEADGVWKSYDNHTIPVLSGVDFKAFTGQSIALCGPSGCGKSTLLHLLGRLDDPDRGDIRIGGICWGRSVDLVHLLRHEIGFVFQLHNLIPGLTLEENCLLPAAAAGKKQTEARARLRHLAECTGLSHRLGQRIQNLSGGERQRTALCRALMNRPRILLADEPTGSLDDRSRDQVFQLLLDLVNQEGITLIMATHDRQLAERCRRTVWMRDGKVYESS